jgi:hypothetical protein
METPTLKEEKDSSESEKKGREKRSTFQGRNIKGNRGEEKILGKK